MKMSSKLKSAYLQSAVALFGLTLLAGCSTPISSLPPVSNWSNIQVAESIERLELYARPDGMVLSARDETAVAQFLQSYGRFGDGPLYINVPTNQAVSGGVNQTHGLIKGLMSNVGLGGAPVQTGQYQAQMGRPAPIIVSYRRLKTVPIDCRQMGSLSDTYSNQPYSGFGCSYHANLAAMIGDPRQLLEPYDTTPPDMKRRMEVYDKYIKGENPASSQPERQEISATEGN